MFDLFSTDIDLLEAVQLQGLISNISDKNERKKIIEDCKKYYHVLKQFEGSVYLGQNKDDIKYFTQGKDNYGQPYDKILYMTFRSINSTNGKKINEKLNEINKTLTNYHFKLNPEYATIYIVYGKGRSTISDEITKDDYDIAISLLKKVLQKYSTLKPAMKIKSYKSDDLNLTIVEYDTWKIKWSGKDKRTREEYDEKFGEPFTEFCKELKNGLSSYNIKLGSDGDEEYGYLYIKK